MTLLLDSLTGTKVEGKSLAAAATIRLNERTYLSYKNARGVQLKTESGVVTIQSIIITKLYFGFGLGFQESVVLEFPNDVYLTRNRSKYSGVSTNRVTFIYYNVVILIPSSGDRMCLDLLK